jgi:hypothetical protein
MRQSTFTVFDEFLPKNTISTLPVYTGAQFNIQLGRSNQLGVHIVADNLTLDTATSRSLYCFVDHSADGRSWMQRSNQANTYNTADADLQLVLGTSGTVVQQMWSDAAQGKSTNAGTGAQSSTGPLLGFVRLKLFFDSAAGAGHVRMNITQRDQ